MQLTIDIDMKNETHRQILRLLLGDEPTFDKTKQEHAEEPKQEATTEQHAEEPEQKDEMTADTLRAVVVEAHKKIGKPEANAIVKKYGAGISKIDPSDYQACADELKAAMEDA